jgi:DNA-directed RNA polymerase subunit M/transcription elongation factor TFIIS
MPRTTAVTDRKRAPRSTPRTAQASKSAPVETQQIRYEDVTSPDDFDKLMEDCTWLDEENPTFTSLVEEILISMKIDPDATIALLERENVTAESLYWELPSMSLEEEKYKENIAAEFSIIKGIETTTQCPKCEKYEYYIDVKQTRSADEAPTVFSECSTCNPRM